jgi:hypothetical protein
MPGGIPVYITGDWVSGLVNYLSIKGFDQTGRRMGAGNPRVARWHLSAGTVEPFDAERALGGSGGITTDGTVMVNRIAGTARWDGAALTPLPAPPGYDHVAITSISADGTVLAGNAVKSSGGSIEPFRWGCRR